jgi:hypothetical protein
VAHRPSLDIVPVEIYGRSDRRLAFRPVSDDGVAIAIPDSDRNHHDVQPALLAQG